MNSLPKKCKLAERCKKCGSQSVVKNGLVRHKQRYKCKHCGYNFTIGDAIEKVKPEAKALAMLLYGSGKATYGMIARLFNVSRTTVLYWIRTMGRSLPIPEIDTEVKEVQIDEMWHFIEKTKVTALASRGLS